MLVSGRGRSRLEAVAGLIGADGVIAELGAADAASRRAGARPSTRRSPRAACRPRCWRWSRAWSRTRWPPRGARAATCCAGARAPARPTLVASLSGGALRLADNGGGRAGAGERIYHLLPAGAGKAAAVAADIAARGIEARACLAVGNSRQDLEVGEVVGAVAIVANGAAADPLLAARAPWVTAGAYGEGVLEAVEEWLSRRG